MLWQENRVDFGAYQHSQGQGTGIFTDCCGLTVCNACCGGHSGVGALAVVQLRSVYRDGVVFRNLLYYTHYG